MKATKQTITTIKEKAMEIKAGDVIVRWGLMFPVISVCRQIHPSLKREVVCIITKAKYREIMANFSLNYLIDVVV